MKTLLIRFGPAVAWMGVIFILSSLSTLPGPKVVWWDFVLKKLAHMMEYGLLFFLWARGLNWDKPEHKKSYWLTFLIVMVYAASDELHQSLTPGRHPKITDVGFDLLGAFLVYSRLVRAI